MGSVSDSSAPVAAATGIKEAAEQRFLLRRSAMSKAKDRLSKTPATPAFKPKLEQ
jgi:hypothetical protein